MKKEQRRNLGEKIAQGILLIVLITLTIFMMSDVKKIQGNARVINYAGIIRGATQREIKLEISGNENDVLIKYLDDIFYGLTNGGGKYQLTTLNDQHYQKKLTELHTSWLSLKDEISLVREKGYQQTNIIKMSEEYFYLADETVTAAEDYSQKCATRLDQIEKALIFVIALVILMMIKESVSAVVLMKKNRELNKKAYIDLHTGLPNRSRVEELIAHYDHFDEPTAIIVFDLNDLKVVNDSLGHLAGDTLIMNFAHIIRTSIPEKYFVGRYGGDEFIAVTHGMGKEEMKACLASVREQMAEESKSYPDTPLSYAVGFALASEFPGSTMQELFNYADKNMYINKNHVKREEAAAQRQLDYKLLKLLNMHGKNFTHCLYCDVKLDTYRTIRANNNFFLASDGSYSGAADQIVKEKIGKQDKDRFRQCLKISYLCEKMRTKEDVMELKYDVNEQDSYSRLTFIPVDWEKTGMLHHFLLAFETIRQGAGSHADAKEQLTIYYEQLKQSILENDSYVDALLEQADVIYTVNLTNDILERIILLGKRKKESLDMLFDYPLPGSYRDYCSEYKRIVTQETLGSYRMADDCEKLLKRFDAGEKYCQLNFVFMEIMALFTGYKKLF